MRNLEISDFLVETNGQCFICGGKVSHGWHSNELASPGSYTSVHRLSQYLKMDMRKVFHENESIPSELLENVKRSRLKVPLCWQCTKWNEKVSGLCLQLEKIETEVSFYLDLIHGNLLSLEKDGGTNSRCYKLEEDGVADSNVKLLEKERIVKALRTETRQKCSQRLKCAQAQPIVKVQNMTPNQVSSKKQMISSKSENYVKQDVDMEDISSGTRLDDISQINNKCPDVDGEEYFDDDTEYIEYPIIPISQEESNDDNEVKNTKEDPLELHSTEGNQHSSVHPQTESARNLALESSSSSIVVPSSSRNIEKLTFVRNPENNKFKCNICSEDFANLFSLKTHYDYIHLQIRHKCNVCGKEFTSETHCARHYRSAHVGIRRFQRLKSAQPSVKVQKLASNQACSKQQKIKSKYNTHVQPEIEDGSGNWLDGINQIKNEGSDVDGEEYLDDDDNAEYIEDPIKEDESNDDPLQITTGDQSYRFQSRTATETVNDDQRASTSGLNSTSVKILSSPSSEHKIEKLNPAQLINPETGKFKCNVCSIEYTTISNLKSHYDSIHLKRKVKCTLCGKEFANKTTCTSHHKTVHVGVRFKCNLCGRCFRQKYTLIEHHEAVHLGKRFQCSFCTKSYYSKGKLTHHMRLAHHH